MASSARTLSLPLTALALALAACSGQTAPEPEPSDSSSPAAIETTAPQAEAVAATPEAAMTEAAPATPSPSASPSPEPTPKPSPTPSKAPPAAPAPKPEAATPVAVAAIEPPAAFARCAVCHNAAKGAPDKLGPNLYGVFGHKMGQGSFSFSEALKTSGLTMDEATLDQWLENPRQLVPGNRMSFPGLKDPAKRQEIIAYLKQLR